MGTGSVATNTAVGSSALNANTTGANNTAVGKDAMFANTTGTDNTAVGSSALAANTVGQFNTAVGRAAMFSNTTGGSNTAVGTSAMRLNTTGGFNTALGPLALYNNSTGTYNTAVGYYALIYTQSGGNFDTYTNSTGIGNDSRVAGSNEVQAGNSSTQLYAYGYNTRSDIRDKADVRETVFGLDFINKVQAVDFRWNYRDDYFEKVEEDVTTEKTDPETGVVTQTVTKEHKLVPVPNDGSKKRTRFHQGVIAQQVKEVMDELGVDFAGYQDHTVKGGCDVLSIGYTEFVGPLIKAVQELSSKVTALEQSLSSAVATISSLEQSLSSAVANISSLQAQ